MINLPIYQRGRNFNFDINDLYLGVPDFYQVEPLTRVNQIFELFNKIIIFAPRRKVTATFTVSDIGYSNQIYYVSQ